MNRNRLGELRAEYPGSSWAIWSDEYPAPGCVENQSGRLTEFIEANCDQLNPGVVFLSLNPDAFKPLGYRNFHSPRKSDADYLLKEIIQDRGLEHLHGAYLTDIVPRVVEKSSETIAPANADTEQFLDQIRALGQSNYHIICLSQQAFSILESTFDSVPHTMSHGIDSFSAELQSIDLSVYQVAPLIDADRSNESPHRLATQLQYLNNSVIG